MSGPPAGRQAPAEVAAAAAADPQAPGAYGALFARYLEAGLQRSLAQVQADPDKVAEEVRSQAWHLLSFALRAAGTWPVTAELLLALSPKMVQAGHREQWLAYLEQGLACSREAGDTQTAAALQLEIGEVLRHLGRLAPAGACFHDALATFTAAGDTVQAAAAEVCLANLLVLQEEWTQALALCEQALAAVPQVHPVRARALFVAADAHVACHNDVHASDYYRQSQMIWEALQEHRWTALCLQNQARLSVERRDIEQARRYFRAALDTFSSLDALHSQAVVQMNWGIAEYVDGNLQPALALYQCAESTFRALGDTRHIAMICNNIGLAHCDRGEWQQAETYYQESIRLWRESGMVLACISVEINLAKLLLDTGQLHKAALYLEHLLAKLATTERDEEHRRLYAEIRGYMEIAADVAIPSNEQAAAVSQGEGEA